MYTYIVVQQLIHAPELAVTLARTMAAERTVYGYGGVVNVPVGAVGGAAVVSIQ
jgi:hypothetical protein